MCTGVPMATVPSQWTITEHECYFTCWGLSGLVLFRYGHQDTAKIYQLCKTAIVNELIDYTSRLCRVPVLVLEGLYYTKAHLFQPCQGQRSVSCIRMIWSTHTSQTKQMWLKHA